MIKASNLNFFVDNAYPGNFFYRWIARVQAARILNHGGTFQFGGYDEAKKNNWYMIDAPCIQVAHWILRCAGYSVCIADIETRLGRVSKHKKVCDHGKGLTEHCVPCGRIHNA